MSSVMGKAARAPCSSARVRPAITRVRRHCCRHCPPQRCCWPPLMVCRQTIAGQWHHAMLMAQLGQRHTAFGLPQDPDDLSLSVSACLYSESPHASCRENSTFAAPCFRGGLPSGAGSTSSVPLSCRALAGRSRPCAALRAAQAKVPPLPRLAVLPSQGGPRQNPKGRG